MLEVFGVWMLLRIKTFNLLASICNGSDVGSLNTHFGGGCNDSVVRKCTGMNLKQENGGDDWLYT